MSLIEEIHNQPPFVRRIMYWLAVTTTFGIIGFFAITSIERNMFFAIHPDEAERQAFVAHQQARTPQPLALMSKAMGTLTASIGSVLGFDDSKGFDRNDRNDKVYLLPLSE